MRPARTTKAYLSLTGRFIEQSWQMQACTPGTVAWTCTQQTGYLMTGALLTMSTVQTEAQAWCRLPLIVVGFLHHRKQKKYVRLEGTGTPGVEWRKSSPEFRSCGLLKSQLKRFQLEDMQGLWEAIFWYGLSNSGETVATAGTTASDRNTEKRRTNTP